MRILLLAPQPFFQERGTPIAVDLVLRTLSAAGHEVDALVYPEGRDVSYPGVRLYRIRRVPFISGIGPGFSLKKVVYDAILFFKAFWFALRRRYDIVHAVEESAFIALMIKGICGVPYLYDMDSSMADQMVEKYAGLRRLSGFLRWCEAQIIRHAEVVMPVCDALAQRAKLYQPKRLIVLHDISLLPDNGRQQQDAVPVFAELGVSGGPIVMYVGNLEAYQGIDLLLESFARANGEVPEAKLVIIGGTHESITQYKQKAQALGLAPYVCFAGPKPVAELSRYLRAADVLVSPRLLGGNTPMKIYSYLDSGTAVLATNLATHTQIMDSTVAQLAEPTPKDFSRGLVELLRSPQRRQSIGEAGHALIARRHSYPIFKETLTAVYAQLEELSAKRKP